MFIHEPLGLEIPSILILLIRHTDIPRIPSHHCSLLNMIPLKLEILRDNMREPGLRKIRSPSQSLFDYRLDEWELFEIGPLGETFGVRSAHFVELYTHAVDPGHICCGGGDENVVLVAGRVGAGFN